MTRQGRVLGLVLAGSVAMGCGRDVDDILKAIRDGRGHGHHGQADAGGDAARADAGAAADSGAACGTAAPAQGWARVATPTTFAINSLWTTGPGSAWMIAAEVTGTVLRSDGAAATPVVPQPP